MSVEFGSPAALWLIAAVPLVWLVARTSRVPARRRARLAAIRSAMLALVALALAEPVVSWPDSRVALVCLVDASHSVSSAALTAAADAIDEATEAIDPAVRRVLVFGGGTASVRDTGELRRLASPEARGELDAMVLPAATNVEQALSAARAEIPPGMNGQILLLSDGHETEGDSRRAIERLAARRVPVFTRTLAVRDLGDTWIDAIRLGRGAMAAAPAIVDVVLGSQVVRPVEVVLLEGSRVLGRTRVDAGLGSTTAAIDVRFETPGPHLVEARLSAAAGRADPLEENNRLLAELIVEPRLRVLFVHAGDGPVPLAARLLVEAGLEVTDVRAEALPRAADAFRPWDVVVLSNVARPLLAPESMAALASWVEQRGGGLLFIGGPALSDPSPDRPDYRHTELERVLPVTFDREDEAEVALLVVLDRSWSMNGLAMELSKTAAEAAANTLEPMHLVGVLTFNNQPTWDVPLARLRDARATLHDAIARIQASGPTDIYVALTQAYDALASVPARARHLILLSDGQTQPADFEGLMRKMTEARVTVSTVALGVEADVALLGNLAAWGGGRSYAVQDAKTVPEIFVKEAKSATSQAADAARGVRPVRGSTALFRDLDGQVPEVAGHNAVTRKPGAIDLFATPKGEPLLTVWPAGLGRTGMLATDVEGRWTPDWLEWPGLGSLLGTSIRSLAVRQPAARTMAVGVEPRQGAVGAFEVTVLARDQRGRSETLASPALEIRAAGRAPAVVDLLQTGPGRYQSRVVTDAAEPLAIAIVEGGQRSAPMRVAVTDPHAEYRFGDPDERWLAAIAHATGGAPDATGADLRRSRAGAATARRAIAPWLLLAALAGWLADIAIRRAGPTFS